MSYFNKISIFVLIIPNLFNFCELNIKTWNSNFDDIKLYENDANWEHIPCRIVFGEDSVLFLDQHIKAKQIILPLNGQIVFGDKATISLIDDQKECNGRDLRFSPKVDRDWFDPFNWNQTIDMISANQLIDEITFSGRSEDKNPIPHMERIPCIYDSVSFLENTSFKVNINTKTKIKIKSLKIWKKDFNNEDFKTFSTTAVGKQLFSIKDLDNNLVIDQNSVCSDPKGCVCGNEEPIIQSLICQSVSKYGCPSLECSDPIRPVGHCCDICASMLTIAFKSDFSLDLVEGMILEFERKADYKSVRSYLHKLKSTKFQFIAIDLEEKGRADRMINAIERYFTEGPGIYSMQSIQINSSTDWSTGGAGLWVLFIFFILILIGSGIGVSYYLKKRRITAPFAFARFRGFDNEDGVELRMGTTPHEALDPNSPIQMSSSSVKYDVEPVKEVVTFENPVFKKHELKEELKAKESQQKSSKLTSIENPFFD